MAWYAVDFITTIDNVIKIFQVEDTPKVRN